MNVVLEESNSLDSKIRSKGRGVCKITCYNRRNVPEPLVFKESLDDYEKAASNNSFKPEKSKSGQAKTKGGSGFYIKISNNKSDWIMTCAHVLDTEPIREIKLCFQFNMDKHEEDEELILEQFEIVRYERMDGLDRGARVDDLALIKLNSFMEWEHLKASKVIPLFEWRRNELDHLVQTESEVTAIHFGIDYRRTKDLQNAKTFSNDQVVKLKHANYKKYTIGSTIDRALTENSRPRFWFKTFMDKGASGGAVLNKDLNLIGIIAQGRIHHNSTLSAIPINTVNSFIQQIS